MEEVPSLANLGGLEPTKGPLRPEGAWKTGGPLMFGRPLKPKESRRIQEGTFRCL